MTTKRTIPYKAKNFSSKMFREGKNWVCCSVRIILNQRSDNFYVSPSFKWGTRYARLGNTNNFSDYKNYKTTPKSGLVPISDTELKNEMENIIKRNPHASSTDIENELNVSCYRVNRLYMSVKRKLL